jgi:hypothetical protein
MAPFLHSGVQRAPLAAHLLVLAALMWPRTADGAPRGFVPRAGARFELDGAPFHVVGANQCVPAAGLRGATRAAGARELAGCSMYARLL